MKLAGVIAAQLCSEAWRHSAMAEIESNRVLQLLRDCGAAKVVISSNQFLAGNLPDIYPGKGLLSILHSAAYHFEGHNILLLALDMPKVDKTMLQWLVSTGKAQQCSAHFRTSLLPFYLHNDGMTREYLEHHLSNQTRPLGRVISGISACQIMAHEPHRLLNVNGGSY
ncbi:NTP transferase domain-containing protein [Lacimicrobium sp. SS2-24]|uniref:molybdenum cofactor guanylyltransferase n=1 Tax=Lacimicrobium sp. SS2-24 TaxID=2005569 RepID=UPI000B4B9704|nr:NTP transferase domain-containing protein [Lacimicrobium sp. SS2-24]